MTKLWKSVAAGAVGGAAGVAVMNAYQRVVNVAMKRLTGEPALNLDDAATRDVANAVIRSACGCELGEAQQACAFLTVQYTLGVSLGALYGVLAECLPSATACSGTAFGAAAWLAGDEIGVPVLGIANGPEYHSFAGHANALAGHAVFGAATHCARAVLLRLFDGVG